MTENKKADGEELANAYTRRQLPRESMTVSLPRIEKAAFLAGLTEGKRIGREEGAQAEAANWIQLQEQCRYFRDEIVTLQIILIGKEQTIAALEVLAKEGQLYANANAKLDAEWPVLMERDRYREALDIANTGLREIGGSHRNDEHWLVMRAHQALEDIDKALSPAPAKEPIERGCE